WRRDRRPAGERLRRLTVQGPGDRRLRGARQGRGPLLAYHAGGRCGSGTRPGHHPAAEAERPRPRGAGELRIPEFAERRSGGARRALQRPRRPALLPEVGDMSPRELPEYLRPVPGPTEGSAAEAPVTADPPPPTEQPPPPPEPSSTDRSPPAELPPEPPAPAETPASPDPVAPLERAVPARRTSEKPAAPNGLIPPTSRGHSGA